jgi:membrane-bound lytic murein transglycosylase D
MKKNKISQFLTCLMGVCFFLFGVGCAHWKESSIPVAHSSKEAIEDSSPPSRVIDYHFEKSQSFSVGGLELENTDFDVPIKINAQVEKWVEYFTGRGRRDFERFLERSELFIPYMVPALEAQGLPLDLVYIAMIESGFTNHARSHARAVGPWQFMQATGERYGLRVNWWVDQRRDTHLSTLAAAQYLKELYGVFENWELAAAAYNAGEFRIAQAVRRYGSRDFWAISRQSLLAAETRDYVPKWFAATIVSKNRTQFGFRERYTDPLVEDPSLALSEAGSMEFVDSRGGEVIMDRTKLSQAQAEAPFQRVALPNVSRSGRLNGKTGVVVEVESPADLFQIAQAAGVPYEVIQNLNPALLRWFTPPELESYSVFIPASAEAEFQRNYFHPDFIRQAAFRSYQIRSGDTLSRISYRFGVPVQAIQELNRMGTSNRLVAGKTLFLPIPQGRREFVSNEPRTGHESERAPRAELRQISAEDRKQAQARNL